VNGHQEKAWADAERSAMETAVGSAELPATEDVAQSPQEQDPVDRQDQDPAEPEGAVAEQEAAVAAQEAASDPIAPVESAGEPPASAGLPPILGERDPPVASDGRGRSTEGRLARLHLRVGLLALARAELETMAADGILDVEAMADLAEARWRSGDLVGAGEAAQAHLGGGGDEVLAHVVAAEALAAQGRTGDARRHVSAVMERAPRDVEALFSGQPRSRVWPQASAGTATAHRGAAPQVADSGSLRLPLPFEDTEPLASEEGARPQTRARPAEPSSAAGPRPGEARSADAGEELAAIRADLDAGRLAAVAAGLSLLVRSEPRLAAPIVGLAEEALEQVDPDSLEAASLHLVRGDAYRLLGRELEAVAAFQGSRRSFARKDGRPEESEQGESPADALSAEPPEETPSPEAPSIDEGSTDDRRDAEEST
jgi:hypothetical protein